MALDATRLGEESRRAAVEGFMDLFAPGNIVDLAWGSNTTGPPGAEGACRAAETVWPSATGQTG
jgi:hypothetical protein